MYKVGEDRYFVCLAQDNEGRCEGGATLGKIHSPPNLTKINSKLSSPPDTGS